MKKKLNGFLKRYTELQQMNLEKSNKNNKYKMEFWNAWNVINNLDYHVYHYPRLAQPLCLGYPILAC